MKIRSIDPIDPITPITPITPIKRKPRKTRSKRSEIITDENLGRNVDISVTGPVKAPNCFNCVSYFVTWDSSFPHGCRKFEFKGRDRLPSLSVYEANKCHCQFFEENPKIKK